MFEERFKSVFSKIEIELACSLPVLNMSEERIFFYSTKPNDEESYRIGNIVCAYSRDISVGNIEVIDFDEATRKIVEKCKDEIIRPRVIDDEALELEDKYRILYDGYFQDVICNKVDNKKKSELIKTFNYLVPECNLKKLYYVLGGEYFG